MERPRVFTEFRIKTNEKIFRIRRWSGFEGGSVYYHHADVVATSRREAMTAARENRVTNWRTIDKFDTTNTTFAEFEFLYRLDPKEAKLFARPRTREEQKMLEQKWSRFSKPS
jgi:hypothetical protein